MKKKFLALVLTLAMVLSLVPATALAANGTQEGNNQGLVEVTGSDNDNNLTMTKTVTPVLGEDGTYTVHLESYATGSVIPTQAPVPMDFVLVLDVSGSMKDKIASYDYQKTEKTSWSAKDFYFTGTTYYEKIGEEYYPVSCQRKSVPNQYIGSHYEYWLEANGQPLGNTGEWGEQLYSGPLYTYGKVSGSEMSKLAAMKTAVNNFIESVAAQKNGDDPVAHRISIVKFAGKSNDGVGNDTYPEDGFTYNYTQKVTELTDVTAAGSVASLKRDVNALTAGGATRADLGMEKADGVLNGRQDAEKDRPSVVIMFTDGEPTTSNDFEWKVAGAAVDTAKTLKAGGTKVYTIGMFNGANPEDIDGAFNKYMNGVSSKYPDAVGTKKNNKKDYNGIYLGTPAGGNYYFKADNAGALDQVFQTISESTTVTSPLDASAVVVDNVPSNFALNKESVQVYTENCIAKNGETFKWDTKTESTIRPTIDDQSISVTGFNFSENWCGLEGDTARGKKLIIEFTIKCTNYGGTQPTNEGAYIKASSESTEKIIDLQNPTVPVTISLGIPEAELNEKLGVSSQKDYDGSGIPILSALSDKANDLVDGINNAYVDMALTVTVGNDIYTYKIPAKATTGSWYQGDSTSPMSDGAIGDVKTSKDVNRSTSNEVDVYTYNFDLTLSDAAPNGAAAPAEYKDNNASFKITPRNVTLTSATDIKEYDGEPLTNDKITEGDDGFVKGEGANYTVTGSQTNVGESDNTFTYTLKDGTTASNYNITTKFGKLTITEKAEVPYTLIFDANGGAWDIEEIPDYALNTEKNKATKGDLAASYRVDTSTVTEPKKDNATFLGWGTREDCLPGLILKPTVAALKHQLGGDGNTVTLYAVWKTEETTDPAGNCTYTIRQHYWKNLNDTDTGDNVSIKNLTAKSDEKIASLIDGKDKNQDWRGNHYFYDSEKTTVNGTTLANNAKLENDGTVIDLYYYLDNWKDADKTPGEDTDSATGGDGTPDYKQILIEYKAHTPLVGEVSREFEIQTLEDNQTVATPTGATAKANENAAYAFAYWIKGKVNPEKTEAEIENTAICYENKLSGVTINPVTGGETYIYTAVFLKDVTGKIEEGKDKPDGIPDAWQCKVTFKVVNGNWNNNTNQDIVTYVTKKNAEGKSSTNGTAKLTADQIPAVGNQPNSGYKSSGRWDKTPSTDLEIKEDTVFTYTYDQKSGGSGGSGGSHKPTVTIPDNVPTGLNGKDHYAYVVGYPDGMVYPQKNITRAEVATIFFRLLTDETREANMTKSNSYNDMKDGAWYTCAVSTLSKMGIIKGYEDGSFKPDASISRAEFAAIAARFDPDGDKTPATFSDVSSHWAKDEISIAANHGWIKGYEDGSFKPDQKITRAETMTLVNRVLKRLPETKDDLHKDMKTWPDNQNESAWFYLAVQEATNSHYQNLKKDGTHETWESMRETRDWAALEK